MMPNVCTFKLYKEVISLGYSIIFVYNTVEKKDIFRVIVNKEA